ncbi:hypothetical protein LTR53_010820 [Teratosphaeriaceae sp. CCFEE 6253]|nr:hypothetical protein LTR53_010820 [Teratosphaeriaceae sp. CCFEE 6253]
MHNESHGWRNVLMRILTSRSRDPLRRHPSSIWASLAADPDLRPRATSSELELDELSPQGSSLRGETRAAGGGGRGTVIIPAFAVDDKPRDNATRGSHPPDTAAANLFPPAQLDLVGRDETQVPKAASIMAEDGAKAAVDATPINQLERRNSLEKHLQFRPEEQDLKNRHILLDTTAAPALQARQAELERQRITDNLKKARNGATDPPTHPFTRDGRSG